MATELLATGRCNTSLTSKTVAYLKQACTSHGLTVTPTGSHGRIIKEDYIASIWVAAMDFADIIEESQNEIRKFISWLVKQTLSEIAAIARDSFHVEVASRKKGEICERILEALLEDPELPTVHGFNSETDQNAAAANQQSKPHEHSREEPTDGQALDAVQTVASLVSLLQNSTAGQPQPLLTALANAAVKPAASNQEARVKKATNKAAHSVNKQGAADIPGGPPASQNRASARKIRQIAAAMLKEPASAILLIPALEQVADEIFKE